MEEEQASLRRGLEQQEALVQEPLPVEQQAFQA